MFVKIPSYNYVADVNAHGCKYENAAGFTSEPEMSVCEGGRDKGWSCLGTDPFIS